MRSGARWMARRTERAGLINSSFEPGCGCWRRFCFKALLRYALGVWSGAEDGREHRSISWAWLATQAVSLPARCTWRVSASFCLASLISRRKKALGVQGSLGEHEVHPPAIAQR